MNAPSNLPPITAEDLDRLADGTLPAAERRALLSRFDAEPDAWRRCALAFLEAQAWRDAFGPMTMASAEAPERPSVPQSRTIRAMRPLPRFVPIALAAGLMIAAFLLGRSTGGPGSPDRPGEPIMIADNALPDRNDVSRSPSDPADRPASEPIDASSRPATFQTVGYLNMPTDLDPESPTVELPVICGPGIDDRWLRDQPSFIPDDVRLAWEAQGYEVESQRRLVSVQLDDDGHYLTIPVDEVLLYTADRTTY